MQQSIPREMVRKFVTMVIRNGSIGDNSRSHGEKNRRLGEWISTIGEENRNTHLR